MGLPIPLLPLLGILQTKIGSQVDHAHTHLEQIRHQFHGGPIGRGKKHHVALLQSGLLRITKAEVEIAAQIGEHVCHGGTRLAPRRYRRQLHLGMYCQQTQ